MAPSKQDGSAMRQRRAGPALTGFDAVIDRSVPQSGVEKAGTHLEA